MQAVQKTPSLTVPATNAAHIAALLERCAAHEDERAKGKVNFPLLVMRDLALEAHHWARYLRRELSAMHPAVGGTTAHSAGATATPLNGAARPSPSG